MQPPSPTDIRGIDVSRWQGAIDWQSVRGAGIGLSYIKSSEGADFIDPNFERNYEGARAAGIPCGFYHFMNATDAAGAQAQAEYFARVIGGHRAQARPVGDLPYDHRRTAEEFTEVCAAFLARVEQLTGIVPMIYSSAYGAREYLLEPLSRYPLWVANYGVAIPEANPRWSRWAGFQYSETGRVAGIDTRVDLDRFTQDALISDTELPDQGAPATTRRHSGVIYYSVREGDTLWRIARRYDVTVSELAAWNAIADPNRIWPGQVLRIFSPRSAVPEGGEVLHVVSAGENLTSIAQHYGVSVQALISANDLPQPDLIHPGLVLHVPRAGFVARPSTPAWPLDRCYVVRRGDTLAEIGARFGAPWQVLAAANGLSDPDRIFPGQVLRVTYSPLATRVHSFTGCCVTQPGESLERIAARYKTSVAELRTVNGLTAPMQPQTGRVLRVQPDGWIAD